MVLSRDIRHPSRLEPDLELTFAKCGPRRRRTAVPTCSPAVPSPGIVDRHRCDEPLCTADDHLGRGTAIDNRRDMLARAYRAADIDIRGCEGSSRAIRAAVRLRFETEVSQTLWPSAQAAMLLGDPYRHQLTLARVQRRADSQPSRFDREHERGVAR